MIIGGYSMGATEGVIYVRAEFTRWLSTVWRSLFLRQKREAILARTCLARISPLISGSKPVQALSSVVRRPH